VQPNQGNTAGINALRTLRAGACCCGDQTCGPGAAQGPHGDQACGPCTELVRTPAAPPLECEGRCDAHMYKQCLGGHRHARRTTRATFRKGVPTFPGSRGLGRAGPERRRRGGAAAQVNISPPPLSAATADGHAAAGPGRGLCHCRWCFLRAQSTTTGPGPQCCGPPRCQGRRAVSRCRGVLGCCPTERQGPDVGVCVSESSGRRGRTGFCLDALLPGTQPIPLFQPACHQTATVDIRLFRLRGVGNSPSPGLVKTN
jgi:hypothetical protein